MVLFLNKTPQRAYKNYALEITWSPNHNKTYGLSNTWFCSGLSWLVLLAAPGCCWLFLAAPGCFLQLWAAPSCFWLLSAAFGWLVAAPGCSGLMLAGPGCVWLLLAASDCSWPLGCSWLLLLGLSWVLLVAPCCGGEEVAVAASGRVAGALYLNETPLRAYKKL